MTSSVDSSRAQRVPAWKRLGLVLKQPAAASEPANGGTPAVGHLGGTQHKSQSAERKPEAPQAKGRSLDVKRPRRESWAEDKNAQPKKKPKSVSFGATPTKDGAGDTSKATKQKPQQQKKAKGPAKKQSRAAPPDLQPALEYLRLWKASRDGWKFNKNHQSTLINHVFDADGIPAVDIDTFYDYIRDLKGFVRARLREAAMAIQAKDAAEGSSAFPAGTTDVDSKQRTYEKLLTDLLRPQHSGQKRKGFNEGDYVASSQDADVVIRRLVKRMRAELILGELPDGERTDDSQTTQSRGTIATSDTNAGMAPGGDKRLRLNDGTGKRRRKLRVNTDDSSSSESESESESDTSSDSSSDESDDAHSAAPDGTRESSSSSSSESSESSSESGDESDSGDDGESDGEAE